ncbi:CoA transferase [Streptosporangium amethystogenes]|uniref:CoA transferase n=1 Tax=Streptosporangium amethystogenes TaxID=2002 RepID=UPI000A0362D2|nr:CoA transferase [Streptosporangium amethystogenes]
MDCEAPGERDACPGSRFGPYMDTAHFEEADFVEAEQIVPGERSARVERPPAQAAEQVPDPTGPLSGVVLVDTATLFAGPLAATILGDHGADVIKVEHPEVIDEPWFRSGAGRAEHADLLDGHVGGSNSRHDLDTVVREFERAQAAVTPVYDIRDLFEDPQYQALDTITTVDDEDLGPLRMQNVLFRLSDTPRSIRWTGRSRGADNADVRGGLEVSAEELDALLEKKVV